MSLYVLQIARKEFQSLCNEAIAEHIYHDIVASVAKTDITDIATATRAVMLMEMRDTIRYVCVFEKGTREVYELALYKNEMEIIVNTAVHTYELEYMPMR